MALLRTSREATRQRWAHLTGVLRGVSLLSSCAAWRGGGSMLRVRIVTESTCALLVGSSCTQRNFLGSLSYMRLCMVSMQGEPFTSRCDMQWLQD